MGISLEQLELNRYFYPLDGAADGGKAIFRGYLVEVKPEGLEIYYAILYRYYYPVKGRTYDLHIYCKVYGSDEATPNGECLKEAQDKGGFNRLLEYLKSSKTFKVEV